MKRTILILGLMVLVGISIADTIYQNDYIVFTCNNATSGELLCSTATVDLYNSSGDAVVSGASATNIATGKFKYQVTQSTGRYTAVIDCCEGAIDYAFPVYVTPYTETKANYLDASISSRSTLTTSDNIGINLDDVIGTLDASEIGSNAITADKIAADAITSSELATSAADEIADEVWDESRSEHTTDNTFGGDMLDNDVWTDTKAGYLDASISSRSTLTASDNIGVNLDDVVGTLDLNELGYSPALQSNLTQGIVVLTSTTETQIDNIEADTNELQTNQNWNVWDDSVRTLTSCPCTSEISNSENNIKQNTSAEAQLTRQDIANLNDISASDVWSYSSRTLTSCPCSGWATPSDVDNACISESELNASHGACSYCTATGFSTHSPADVYSYFTSGNNEDVFKADVSSLATQSNISDLQSHGDANWATATGFATPSDISTSESNIISHGDKYWNTSTLTSSEIYSYFISGNNEDAFKADVSNLATQTDITNAKEEIISHGDKYWNTSTLSASEIWSYATRTLTDYSPVWSVATRTLTAFEFAVDLSTTALDNIDARINQSHGAGLYNTTTALTSSDINSIVDAVWDEAQSEHTTAGTFGYYLDRQVSAVDTDVWNYTLGTNRSTARTLNDTYNLLFLWGGSGW